MKFGCVFALAASGMLLAACAPAAPSAPAQQTASTVDGCANPESGAIKPQSPGLPDVRLMGPFLVKSMIVSVDPANPSNFGSVLWSKGNAWLPINEFKGPFYLADGETLSAEEGKSPYATVYFGCRLE